MGDVDICAVMFKYASGLIAMVDTCRNASYGYDQRIEAFGERGMLTAKNELTSTVELAKADGHRMPSAMYSFPQRYVQAANAGCHAALLNTCFI
jgi:myo-inositol 2-dehydrogenase/D-chiro-inositol 1-dehydrogenase